MEQLKQRLVSKMGGGRQWKGEHMAPATNNKPCAQHTDTSSGQPGHTSRTVTQTLWAPGAGSVGSRTGPDRTGLRGLPGRSGLRGLPGRSGSLERTLWAHGTEQALERTLWAHGTERTLWAHGMERALEQTLWAHGTEWALERSGLRGLPGWSGLRCLLEWNALCGQFRISYGLEGKYPILQKSIKNC